MAPLTLSVDVKSSSASAPGNKKKKRCLSFFLIIYLYVLTQLKERMCCDIYLNGFLADVSNRLVQIPQMKKSKGFASVSTQNENENPFDFFRTLFGMEPLCSVSLLVRNF